MVFDVSTSIPEAPNQGSSAAPLAVKDKIILGTSGRNETGRGFVAAYAADTGKLLWKFLVVPEAGQPGSETWADPRTMAYGGGGVWTEPSFDPETNLAYFGTGNPVHMFDPQGRPGDNLYTSSIIALDVDTGKLKWYFQTIPNEAWDYDAVAITQLYDININGEMRKVISQTNRNGFFYTLGSQQRPVHQRRAVHHGELDRRPRPQDRQAEGLRCRARPFRITPAKRSATARRPSTSAPPTTACRPSCRIPTTRQRGLTYFNAMIGEANYFNSRAADPAKQRRRHRLPGDLSAAPTPRTMQSSRSCATSPIPTARSATACLAVSMSSTGDTVKKLESYYPAYSGVLGTDGGLLFMGDIMGKISAYDKDTMKEAVELRHRYAIRRQPDDLLGQRQAVHRADARWPPGAR